MATGGSLDSYGAVVYQVEVDGLPSTVELLPDGRLRIDGRTLQLDVSEIQGLSLYSLLLDGASYEVLVDERAGTYYALVQGRVHRIRVDEGPRWHMRPSMGAEPARRATVRAPLCGLVVDVPVKPGQSVDSNQVVVILESMKMENEIRAPRGGTVADVKAVAGDVVREGDLLIVID